MCCAASILHILLTAQLAAEQILVSGGLLKHTKHIFSIPKVWVLPELRVQPGWQKVSRGRSRKRGNGWWDYPPQKETSARNINTSFQSLIVTVCAFIRFSICSFSYGTRWLPHIMLWIMARLELFVVCHSKHRCRTRLNSLTASIWCTLHRAGTAAGTSTYTLWKIWASFSSCRKMSALPWAQRAGKRGRAVTHGRGQMLRTSRDAQCLMARSPGGPRTGGSCSPSDFPLQFVIKLVLTPCPMPVCRANSPGQDFWPWSTYWKKRQSHCLRASLPLAFVK